MKLQMSDTIKIKIDDSGLRRALAEYASGSARTVGEVVKDQTKLLVRDIVSFTPPSQGKTSPKLGYAAVKADIARALYEQELVGIAAGEPIGDPAKLHRSVRNKYTGRVVKNAKARPAVGVAAYTKKMLGQVGLLASGWNAAAEKLGLNMPPWIARHGSKRGQIGINFNMREAKVVVTNAVKFAGNVAGINRRLRYCLNLRERALTRQLEYAQRSAGRRAGL